MFFKNGRPAASISMAIAIAPEFLTKFNFSFIVSMFQGLTVGIPNPDTLFIASVADFITSGLVPSPVKANIPSLAHDETKILL